MEEIMKNTIRRGLCLLLLLAMTAAMAACGQKNANTNTDEKTMVYAVEAGSAGEEVAKEKGWTVNSVQDQAAALMEVAAGTSDAAVIDLLMAGAMIGPDTSYPNLTYTDSLTQEEYGIGCRQGSDLADFITSVLAEAYQDGTTQALARQFGIREDLLAEMPQTGYTEDAGGDVAYIRGKGTLVVGITEFAPWTIRTTTASGPALTRSWPGWWPSAWGWTWSSSSLSGARRSTSSTARPSTWCGTA